MPYPFRLAADCGLGRNKDPGSFLKMGKFNQFRKSFVTDSGGLKPDWSLPGRAGLTSSLLSRLRQEGPKFKL